MRCRRSDGTHVVRRRRPPGDACVRRRPHVARPGSNVEVALVLGTISGVGGVLRDLLVNRVPVILEKEIYALAALAGASIQVIGALNGHSTFITPWVAAAVCLAIRALAVRYSWSLTRT